MLSFVFVYMDFCHYSVLLYKLNNKQGNCRLQILPSACVIHDEYSHVLIVFGSWRNSNVPLLYILPSYHPSTAETCVRVSYGTHVSQKNRHSHLKKFCVVRYKLFLLTLHTIRRVANGKFISLLIDRRREQCAEQCACASLLKRTACDESHDLRYLLPTADRQASICKDISITACSSSSL